MSPAASIARWARRLRSRRNRLPDDFRAYAGFTPKRIVEDDHEADRKANEAIDALAEASEDGRWPIMIDTSPCSQRLKAVAGNRLKLLDIVEALHDLVLPNVAIPTRATEPIALHATCSTRRMGQEDKLLALANACAEKVVVPTSVGCCAFAGEKGFTRPEMNAHALRTLSQEISGCAAGYSTSRTCEIGLSMHGGAPYRSIASLLDSVSIPCPAAE